MFKFFQLVVLVFLVSINFPTISARMKTPPASTSETTKTIAASSDIAEPATLPSMLLVQPLQRNSTEVSSTNTKAPCGGYLKGMSRLLTSPGITTMVQWKTTIPRPDSTCRIRISHGIDEEGKFQTLKPLDNSADDSGAFECNRRAGEYITKTIDFPPDFTCDKCTLQLMWMASNITYYSCADITVINDKVKQCAGKCQNDGVCSNGVCICAETFHGDYCQYKANEKERSSLIWLLLLLPLLLLGGAAAYYFLKMRKPSSSKPVPFVEEKPAVVKREEPKVERAPDIPAEERKGREIDKRPIGDTCHNGHPLVLSNSDEGCPGGYYICTNCSQVFKCSSGHWICGECPIDYCLGCKHANEEELQELAARRPSNENSQDKSDNIRDPDQPRESAEEYKRRVQPRESKKESGPDGEDILGNYLMGMVDQIIASDQAQKVPEYRRVLQTGKAVWTKTHFMFLIDCSGSMSGSRWESVKIGFEDCLYKLKPMKEIVVTALTFDNEPHIFCREETPTEAINMGRNMPFTGAGTNYKRALACALEVVKETNYENHLVCVIFLSDGLGGYPDRIIADLKDMIEEGKKFLFYTIACETEEDNEMVKMSEELNGEHFKVDNPEAIKLAFSKILAV